MNNIYKMYKMYKINKITKHMLTLYYHDKLSNAIYENEYIKFDKIIKYKCLNKNYCDDLYAAAWNIYLKDKSYYSYVELVKHGFDYTNQYRTFISLLPNIVLLEKIIQSDRFDINRKDSKGCTLLHYCTNNDQREILRKLGAKAFPPYQYNDRMIRMMNYNNTLHYFVNWGERLSSTDILLIIHSVYKYELSNIYTLIMKQLPSFIKYCEEYKIECKCSKCNYYVIMLKESMIRFLLIYKSIKSRSFLSEDIIRYMYTKEGFFKSLMYSVPLVN
jgi:hypothetical protein